METNSVSSKNVLEMITVANEYCHFIEKAHKYDVQDILEYLQKIFPLLYLKGSLLPKVEVQMPEMNERFVTAENWEIIFNELRNKFKPKDNYWTIDHSITEDTDPQQTNLADNLTDVYQDLKDFVLLYSKGTQAAQENAIHDCKHFFETHWGNRLVMAQKYVHYLLYADKQQANNPIT